MIEPLANLKIGSVHVGFPVVQAALSGYSDWPMRVIARRLGASYTLCEVVLDQTILKGGKKNLRRLLRVSGEEQPVGGQLMGSQPAEFATAALTLAAAGFSVIDINFGCPVRKVLGRCRGGFHLSQPDVALEIVGRVRDALPEEIPVTLKMRRGIDDGEESRDMFYTIFDGARRLGAAAITVHGRSVQQRYDGPSCWDFLSEVKRHAGDFPVLGSGDLFTAEACFDMLRQTGVNGVTVARGAIGNPWIFQQARELAAGRTLPDPPSLFEQREVIADHYRLAEEIYGPEPCCRQMRKFGIKYSQLHPDSDAVRRAFVSVREPPDWPAVLEHWYAEDLPGRHPPAEPESQQAAESCG